VAECENRELDPQSVAKLGMHCDDLLVRANLDGENVF
jgi:hypothetical protein